MNKAFIFDMDGVIIDSESVWAKYEKKFMTELLGADVYEKMKDKIFGATSNATYDLACQNGLTIEKEKFMKKYDEYAMIVYGQSKPTNDINKLVEKLVSLHFKIGLVTASRPLWIELALEKIKNKNYFDYILSLSAREDLRPKPYPDGYGEAIKKLGSTPEKTIILEDSNRGIEAAKASGAFTICLREHLPSAYVSQKADMDIENIQTLMTFLDEIKE